MCYPNCCPFVPLVMLFQSNRSSSNALRAQDSSDPAFDKHHTDSNPHDEPSPHDSRPQPVPDTDPSDAPTQPGAFANQDAQPSTDAADGQGSSPAADQNRQSQDGGNEQPNDARFTAADEAAAHADADGRTAHLASLAEQADIRQVLSPVGKVAWPDHS